ncbi:hypothetical protein S245_013035 [Arachis hypogaea]
MQVLKLWQNKFTGSIPSRLGQNGKLTELDLSTNKLKGLVPKSLCFGKKLKILILLNNFFFGSLPNDLGECYTLDIGKLKSVLEILLLHGNRFSGEIPLDIGKLKSVLKMDLSVNNFSGAIPPEICANTKFIAFMITYGLSAAARVQLWK